MPALQIEAAWTDERLLGDFRQCVPQNGRVHLHIVEFAQVREMLFGLGTQSGTLIPLSLGPAKTYALSGTPRTYAIQTMTDKTTIRQLERPSVRGTEGLQGELMAS